MTKTSNTIQSTAQRHVVTRSHGVTLFSWRLYTKPAGKNAIHTNTSPAHLGKKIPKSGHRRGFQALATTKVVQVSGEARTIRNIVGRSSGANATVTARGHA